MTCLQSQSKYYSYVRVVQIKGAVSDSGEEQLIVECHSWAIKRDLYFLTPEQNQNEEQRSRFLSDHLNYIMLKG